MIMECEYHFRQFTQKSKWQIVIRNQSKECYFEMADLRSEKTFRNFYYFSKKSIQNKRVLLLQMVNFTTKRFRNKRVLFQMVNFTT